VRPPAAILLPALALTLSSCKFTHGGRGTRNTVDIRLEQFDVQVRERAGGWAFPETSARGAGLVADVDAVHSRATPATRMPATGI
jgi:hypothetical protein